jgi:hypothetical protein
MSRKSTVNLLEEFESLDVNELHRARAFRDRTVTFPSVQFRYPRLLALKADRWSLQLQFHNHEWQRIPMQWTWCPWGAYRPWFKCPYCGRRVGKLYNGDDFVACRTCCGLRYVSQSRGYGAQHHYQALKLRVRLGGKPSIAEPFPERPFGMHEKTYRRLRARAEWLEGPLHKRRCSKYWKWRKPEYRILVPR